MRYEKKSPSTILFKYDYDGEFRRIQVKQTTRGRPSSVEAGSHSIRSLPRIYKEAPAISKAKYNNLQFLCKSNTIPQAYHSFYDSLRQADVGGVDCLPEPDCEEADESTFSED